MAGAPLGNTNAKKAKRWQKAILEVLARRGTNDPDAAMEQAAEKLVQMALDGDKWAIDHMADRIDGKASQSVDATVDAGANLIAILAAISGKPAPTV